MLINQVKLELNSSLWRIIAAYILRLTIDNLLNIFWPPIYLLFKTVFWLLCDYNYFLTADCWQFGDHLVIVADPLWTFLDIENQCVLMKFISCEHVDFVKTCQASQILKSVGLTLTHPRSLIFILWYTAPSYIFTIK